MSLFCLAASQRITAAAADTLRDVTTPYMGIET
jgi:hypothetical protein